MSFRAERARERRRANRGRRAPVDPITAAERRVAEADHARASARPPRDPLRVWLGKRLITPQEHDAGVAYRDAIHAASSAVVSRAGDGGRGGEPVPPQEIAMRHADVLRACEAAVPAPIRYRWLDPVVVQYRSAEAHAAALTEQGRRAGRAKCHVEPGTVVEITREALALLAEAVRRLD